LSLSSHLLLAATIAATVVGGATPAQGQGTGSHRGLFGASASSSGAPQGLDFTFSLIEAHDSDVPADLGSRLDQNSPQLGGYFTMLIAAADYARQRPRVDFGATVGSALRYEPRFNEIDAVSHNAGIGLSARLPGQATVFVNQTAAYSPSYFYHLFPTVTVPSPGDAITIAPDYLVDRFESFAYGTTLRLTRGSSRGSSVTATGDFNRTDWRQEVGRLDLATYNVGAEVAHGLARTGGISGGYRYGIGEFGHVGRSTTEHEVHVGLNFAPAISVTRRAMFRLNVATSTLETPQSADFAVVAGRRYRLLGDLEGSYLFRRTWQARAKYSRDLEYVGVLGEPVFTDGASASLEGFITYRLNVSTSVRYSTGNSALRRDARNFETYTSDVRLRYAWTPSLGVFAEYLYYFYDFRRSMQIAPGVPISLARNGVRVGLVLWVPALGR
jgi:hypothetical protein